MTYYTSTRQPIDKMSATAAILKGISEEGGLFVPTSIPKMEKDLASLMELSYQELAYEVMHLFFDDIKEADLKSCIQHAYDEKFDTTQIAPVVTTKSAHFLELFHGPTLAFKDMALSILPYLMLVSKQYAEEEQEIVILTATSGDTGKAALEGFAKVAGTKIIVFFPEEGVSDIQKRQMTTQEGDNTLVVGIKGNFDDAQTGVKQLFTDKAYEKELSERGYVFSSANSINIGRLIPQVVYYFYSYMQLVKEEKLAMGEPMNVVVPTGNFGNILAAYYAKEMGLPIKKFICASNKNKVLFDFFENGTYDRNRDFFITNSPSMDILISSNLERLLYHIAGEDTKMVCKWMEDLKTEGKYTLPKEMQEKLASFYGGYIEDAKTKDLIKKVYEEDGYVMDTHTAVAYGVYENYRNETGDTTPCIIASTASPYKFTGSVMGAIDEKYEKVDDFALMGELQAVTGIAVPNGIKGIDTRKILHTTVCEVNQMKAVVDAFLV